MTDRTKLFSAINQSPLFRLLRIAVMVFQLVEFVRQPDQFWLPLPAGSVKRLDRLLSGPVPLRPVMKRGATGKNHGDSHAHYCAPCAGSKR